MGVTGRVEHHNGRHALSIESQLLAIGSGFVVFVALVAIFAAIQQRRRRRNSGRDFHSPLIQSFNSNKQRFRATSRNFGSSSSNGGSPPPMLSPSSDSSNSPQCTPLTPYATFASNAELPLHKHANTESGSVSLAVNYDKEAKSLQLTVLSCHNLPEIQPSNNGQSTLNPYVKIRILPDNQHRIKTRILRNTNNPFFEEQFTISGIMREQLQTYTLHLAALSSDRFAKDVVLGEAFLNLAEVERRRDLNDNENNSSIELKLYPRPAYSDVRSQVFLSIAYNQLTNSINFAVLKMKDLPCDERIGQIDAYIKVYMLLNGQRVAKHKTHVKRRTVEPVFNESFGFDLPSMIHDGTSRFHSPEQILNTISFEVQVLNHNGVTRNELIGQTMVGGVNCKHWQAVREQPGQQVAEWHRIHSQ